MEQKRAAGCGMEKAYFEPSNFRIAVHGSKTDLSKVTQVT